MSLLVWPPMLEKISLPLHTFTFFEETRWLLFPWVIIIFRWKFLRAALLLKPLKRLPGVRTFPEQAQVFRKFVTVPTRFHKVRKQLFPTFFPATAWQNSRDRGHFAGTVSLQSTKGPICFSYTVFHDSAGRSSERTWYCKFTNLRCDALKFRWRATAERSGSF